MKISDDEELLFSYNILKLNVKLKKGMNRERKNISRDSYREMIISICKDSITRENQEIINIIYNSKDKDSANEWNYVDIKYQILSNIDRKILISLINQDNNIGIIYAKQENYEICYLKNGDYESLKRKKIKTLEEWTIYYVNNYKTKKIEMNDIEENELNNWEEALKLIKNLSIEWPKLKEIYNKLDSEIINDHPNANGTYKDFKIEIVKEILNDKCKLMGILLHEICHGVSGATDITKEFEDTLTECLGYISKLRFIIIS